MSFCEFVYGRLTVLVINRSFSAHFLKRRICLFVLRFYGPVNPKGSCRARSIYLATHLLGRLSLLHFPTPSVSITPSKVWLSVPTLASNFPRRISLSVRGAAAMTESR